MALTGVPNPSPPERLTSLGGLVFVDFGAKLWYSIHIHWYYLLGDIMLEVTTETGSVYRIDLINRFWRKNDGPFERLSALQVGTTKCWPDEDPESWSTARKPEVGKHMYIASRDSWWVTTKIVSIEELDQP